MKLDWEQVRARYEQQQTVQPLRGGSSLRVVEITDERLCLQQRLWRDCLSRAALETATTLLGDRPLPFDAIEFAEEMRAYLATGPDAVTDCTRVPNMSAVILKDLGYLN